MLKFFKNKVDRDSVIDALDALRIQHGDQVIVVETPQGTVSLKLKDALIYEGCQGEIVLDSE